MDAGRHGLDAGYPVGVVGALPPAPPWKAAPKRGLRRFVPVVVRMPVSDGRHVPGNEWVARHQIQGAGGLAGHLLGTGLFLPLAGRSAVLAFSGLGYLLALVYAAGMRPRPFCRAHAAGMACLAYEQEGKKTGATDRSACQGSCPREGQHGRCRFVRSQGRLERAGLPFPVCSAPGTIWKVCIMKRRRLLRPSRRILVPPPSAPRTQGRLPLAPRPRITVAEPAEMKPAPKEQPFSKLSTPPTEEFREYELPPFELLHYEEKPEGPTAEDKEEMLEIQQKIIDTLTTFRVDVTPGDITRGPTITRYEVYPARGVRVNTFDQYAKDIALATKAESVNIVAPIPGKDTVGIEIVNRKKVAVPLRELLQDPAFCSPKKKIPLALGKDVYGRTVIGDLASMPHLLVAGATGSGKSVCINSIISSMLLKFRPDELRLILVDPKVVEMQPYSKLPHLIVPVVTDPKKVPNALRWCVNEMEHAIIALPRWVCETLKLSTSAAGCSCARDGGTGRRAGG